MTTTCDDAAAARERMVRELREEGSLRTPAVIEAVRTVPRHRFAPNASLEDAYAMNTALVTKRDEQGLATSSLSAAHIQVVMLEQAQIQPGMRVLEVGTGGCNAAMLAELVGPTGSVTSIDIDPGIVEQAASDLEKAGYGDRVTTVVGDAEYGHLPGGPYDRVIVTATAWDIPPAWSEQLAEDGRIVVPLRMRGLTRSVVLRQSGTRLVSEDYRLCGFVPMQGASGHDERLIPLHSDAEGVTEVALRVDEEQFLDVRGLQRALQQPRLERWTGLEFLKPDETHLWLASHAPVFGLLAARDEAVQRGLVARTGQHGVPALIRGTSFAYRTKRPIAGSEDRFEHGVFAHGPEAEQVAEEYIALLQQCNQALHRGARAQIEVFPASWPTSDLPRGHVIEKRHTRVVVSWPGAHES